MRMENIAKIALTLCFAVYLTGCATPAQVESMTVSGQPSQRVATTPLRNNLAIKDVTGGKETNPMWRSNVGSNEFERALEESLRSVGLLAPRQAGKYILTAHLENIDQPFAGFSMTVTSTVRYVVSDRSSGRDVYSKTITAEFTAGMGDSVLGVQRLKLANEGSVRENISRLIDELFRLRLDGIVVK